MYLYSRSGRRIYVAESRLQDLGYNNLRMYDGSFKDWVKNGGDVLLWKINSKSEINDDE